MNYNPFEKPFASGESSEGQANFVLDRELDLESIYFITVYQGADCFSSILSTFSDNKNAENFYSSIPAFDVNGNGITCYVTYNATLNPKVLVITHDIEQVLLENRTIFVYKLI